MIRLLYMFDRLHGRGLFTSISQTSVLFFLVAVDKLIELDHHPLLACFPLHEELKVNELKETLSHWRSVFSAPLSYVICIIVNCSRIIILLCLVDKIRAPLSSSGRYALTSASRLPSTSHFCHSTIACWCFPLLLDWHFTFGNRLPIAWMWWALFRTPSSSVW